MSTATGGAKDGQLDIHSNPEPQVQQPASLTTAPFGRRMYMWGLDHHVYKCQAVAVRNKLKILTTFAECEILFR